MSLAVAEESSLVILMRRHAIPVLRRVMVEESPDAVILTGTLPSYYLKQLAQEAILPRLGGRLLLNRIDVVRPE